MTDDQLSVQSVTGVDLTLYDGTPAEGEAALFFSRAIAG